MNKPVKRTMLCLATLALLTPVTLYAAGNGQQRRQGPPPEAISACEGKSAGDLVEFTDPRGGTHEGTCRNINGQLVAVPDDMPQDGGRR